MVGVSWHSPREQERMRELLNEPPATADRNAVSIKKPSAPLKITLTTAELNAAIMPKMTRFVQGQDVKAAAPEALFLDNEGRKWLEISVRGKAYCIPHEQAMGYASDTEEGRKALIGTLDVRERSETVTAVDAGTALKNFMEQLRPYYNGKLMAMSGKAVAYNSKNFEKFADAINAAVKAGGTLDAALVRELAGDLFVMERGQGEVEYDGGLAEKAGRSIGYKVTSRTKTDAKGTESYYDDDGNAIEYSEVVRLHIEDAVRRAEKLVEGKGLTNGQAAAAFFVSLVIGAGKNLSAFVDGFAAKEAKTEEFSDTGVRFELERPRKEPKVAEKPKPVAIPIGNFIDAISKTGEAPQNNRELRDGVIGGYVQWQEANGTVRDGIVRLVSKDGSLKVTYYDPKKETIERSKLVLEKGTQVLIFANRKAFDAGIATEAVLSDSVALRKMLDAVQNGSGMNTASSLVEAVGDGTLRNWLSEKKNWRAVHELIELNEKHEYHYGKDLLKKARRGTASEKEMEEVSVYLSKLVSEKLVLNAQGVQAEAVKPVLAELPNRPLPKMKITGRELPRYVPSAQKEEEESPVEPTGRPKAQVEGRREKTVEQAPEQKVPKEIGGKTVEIVNGSIPKNHVNELTKEETKFLAGIGVLQPGKYGSARNDISGEQLMHKIEGLPIEQQKKVIGILGKSWSDITKKENQGLMMNAGFIYQLIQAGIRDEGLAEQIQW